MAVIQEDHVIEQVQVAGTGPALGNTVLPRVMAAENRIYRQPHCHGDLRHH